MIEVLLLFVVLVGVSVAMYALSVKSTEETPFEKGISNQSMNMILEHSKNGKKSKDKLPVKVKKVKPRKEDLSATKKQPQKITTSATCELIEKETKPLNNESVNVSSHPNDFDVLSDAYEELKQIKNHEMLTQYSSITKVHEKKSLKSSEPKLKKEATTAESKQNDVSVSLKTKKKQERAEKASDIKEKVVTDGVESKQNHVTGKNKNKQEKAENDNDKVVSEKEKTSEISKDEGKKKAKKNANQSEAKAPNKLDECEEVKAVDHVQNKKMKTGNKTEENEKLKNKTGNKEEENEKVKAETVKKGNEKVKAETGKKGKDNEKEKPNSGNKGEEQEKVKPKLTNKNEKVEETGKNKKSNKAENREKTKAKENVPPKQDETDAKSTKEQIPVKELKAVAKNETKTKKSDLGTDLVPRISPFDSALLKHVKKIEKQLKEKEHKQEIEIKEQKHSLSSTVEKRYKKEKDLTLAQLFPMVAESQLNDAEIQALIDILLNKQQEETWVEKKVSKNDPLTNLRRQLEEAETRIKEHNDSQQTLAAKIQDLRSNLNDQISKNSTLKKQLEKSDVILQQKLDEAARLHMEQTSTGLYELKQSLESEYQSKLLQTQQIAKKENENKLQELNVSFNDLESTLLITKSALDDSQNQRINLQNMLADTQNKLDTTHKSLEELNIRCQEKENRISSLLSEASHRQSDADSRVYDLQQQLTASENKNSQTVLQLGKVKQECDMLQQKVRSVENVQDVYAQNQVMLKNVIMQKNDLQNQKLQLELELSNKNEAIVEQKSQINLLSEEKDSLAAQVTRPAVEGQENGDIHHDEHIINNNFDDHNNLKNEENLKLNKEISRLKEENICLQEKIEDLRSSYENKINSLKSVLIKTFPSLQSKINSDAESFTKDAEKVAAEIKAKPAEIIEVEKIVEKLVQDPKVLKQLEEVQKKNEQLKIQIDELKLSVEKNEKSDTKTAQELDNYKNILKNTEAVLVDLQSQVEVEEKKNLQTLNDLREEIRNLTAQNRSLVLQLDFKNSVPLNVKTLPDGPQNGLEAEAEQ